MTVHAHTVAFEGVKVLPVEVQAQIASGLPSFQIVGLPDKAVSEARERVRSALHSIGLSLPPKRVVINLAPADRVKAGAYFDLPIAAALLAAMEVIPKDILDQYAFMGELSLDGRLRAVPGILPATMFCHDQGRGLICPNDCGQEAAWIEQADVIAPKALLSLINHIKGTQVLQPPKAPLSDLSSDNDNYAGLDLSDIRGQETAKRALEIAAAGGHNMVMVGPPGAGKSMLAARLPTILPDLSADEALDISTIHSVAGLLKEGKISKRRPFRAPHHSASLPALVGGGHQAKPGEISLAHNGVLFLDEMPEFDRSTLEALRQPLENGEALIARVNYHVTYPAQFQLIGAMNPCRCGHLDDVERACNRAPKCAQDYQAKLSGPLLDRIDLFIDMPAVAVRDLNSASNGETSQVVRERVTAARKRQISRNQPLLKGTIIGSAVNANLSAKTLEEASLGIEKDSRELLVSAAEKLKLSARAFHRVMRVARTIADLDQSETVNKKHAAEALSYRRSGTMQI